MIIVADDRITNEGVKIVGGAKKGAKVSKRG